MQAVDQKVQNIEKELENYADEAEILELDFDSKVYDLHKAVDSDEELSCVFAEENPLL